jgi:hypothetical protein
MTVQSLSVLEAVVQSRSSVACKTNTCHFATREGQLAEHRFFRVSSNESDLAALGSALMRASREEIDPFVRFKVAELVKPARER